VVLPVRNAATTVERAARSILDSTLREIELIVIDDGSADNSAKVVRQISDPRLRLVQQEPLGVCAAANRGAAEAAAPVIARMDADDFSHPARLEKQLSLLCDSGTDMVGCQVRIVDALGQAVESMQRYELWSNSLIEPERIAAMRFVELPLVNPTLLARREVFEPGFRNGAWPEDYDLCLRALGQGCTAAKVPEVLSVMGPGQPRGAPNQESGLHRGEPPQSNPWCGGSPGRGAPGGALPSSSTSARGSAIPEY